MTYTLDISAMLEDGASWDDLKLTLGKIVIAATLERTGGHRGRAAASLGLTPEGFYKIEERCGLRARGQSAV